MWSTMQIDTIFEDIIFNSGKQRLSHILLIYLFTSNIIKKSVMPREWLAVGKGNSSVLRAHA